MASQPCLGAARGWLKQQPETELKATWPYPVSCDRGQGPSAAYLEYLKWGAYMAAALGAWRFVPLTIVRLVAAFTRDEQRHRRCMEVLRLARRDAASISS